MHCRRWRGTDVLHPLELERQTRQDLEKCAPRQELARHDLRLVLEGRTPPPDLVRHTQQEQERRGSQREQERCTLPQEQAKHVSWRELELVDRRRCTIHCRCWRAGPTKLTCAPYCTGAPYCAALAKPNCGRKTSGVPSQLTSTPVTIIEDACDGRMSEMPSMFKSTPFTVIVGAREVKPQCGCT